MKKITVIFFILVTLTCSEQPPGDVPEESRNMTREMLGRWDVTAREGEETYPLWFELEEKGGTIQGRLQRRFGHALPLDSVEVTGDDAILRLEGATYTGSLKDDRWGGTGEKQDGSTFEWTAVRAPELKANENPQWGDPIELFNGKDLSGWVARHPSQPNAWKAEDGVLANMATGSDLVTEAELTDFKLHIEVNYPPESNSGIYLRGRYEIQVQDDYGKEPHSLHWVVFTDKSQQPKTPPSPPESGRCSTSPYWEGG